jgi:hypothetical protein
MAASACSRPLEAESDRASRLVRPGLWSRTSRPTGTQSSQGGAVTGSTPRPAWI